MQAKTGMKHDSIRSMHESIHQYWSHRDSCPKSAVWRAWRDAKSGKKSTAEEPIIRRNISVKNIAIVGVGILVNSSGSHNSVPVLGIWPLSPGAGDMSYISEQITPAIRIYILRIDWEAVPILDTTVRIVLYVFSLAIRSFAQEVHMHRQAWFQQLLRNCLNRGIVKRRNGQSVGTECGHYELFPPRESTSASQILSLAKPASSHRWHHVRRYARRYRANICLASLSLLHS